MGEFLKKEEGKDAPFSKLYAHSASKERKQERKQIGVGTK